MAKALNLEVVTPEKSLIKEEIKSLVVPALNGYLGVLPNHAPLITGLRAGILRYRADGEKKYLAVSGGFMEVFQNKITVLADTAEKPEEIDKARAEAARERALTRLKEKPSGLDVTRAESALQRALSRLRALESTKR